MGINCRYTVENIQALNIGEDMLTYFYELYDDLATRFPNYVTKVDCDAEVTANGIERPAYMTEYPIYMYKFIPKYPSDDVASDANTIVTRNKIFIVTGTHPEYTSMHDLYEIMKMLCESWSTDANLEALRFDAEYYIIPCSGSYGVKHGTRCNYNGVDLNRNAPASDWTAGTQGTNTYGGTEAGSEYETKVFMYYLNQIKPIVFIDHHNFNVGSNKSVYITSDNDRCLAIGANHISVISRKWTVEHEETFGTSAIMIGYCQKTRPTGTRVRYACEQGAYGFTYETCNTLYYGNYGVYDTELYRQTRTSLVETLATDAFLNFLLSALKYFCN